jgi:redox-sensitive bicupin YhaK (pirin superfamily)
MLAVQGVLLSQWNAFMRFVLCLVLLAVFEDVAVVLPFVHRPPSTWHATHTDRYRSKPSLSARLQETKATEDGNGYAPIGVSSSSGSAPLGQSVPSTSTPQSIHRKEYRRIDRIQRFARLPVWPAWNGVAIWAVQRLLGNDVAARLENAWTGRVCPNFFDNVDQTSPFVMLVHHVHSFANYDLFRFIQSTFFPEGFPSHPHRGFVTFTYFLSGGFVHRDSTGCRQAYGVGSAVGDDKVDRYEGHHSQWLHTGAGVLHEEMFDNYRKLPWESTRHELYQIWINVPSESKMTPPFTMLLGTHESPVVATWNDDTFALLDKARSSRDSMLVSRTVVLAGSYRGYQSSAPIASPMCVYHVRLFPRAQKSPAAISKWPQWSVELPDSFETAFLYVRCGELFDAASAMASETDVTLVPAHSTGFFEAPRDAFRRGGDRSAPISRTIVLENRSPSEVADFMFLAGEPLREPVAAQGSMVMSTHEGINQAYSDYASGKFGRPWDSKVSDDEWRGHVQKHPSQYRIDA